MMKCSKVLFQRGPLSKSYRISFFPISFKKKKLKLEVVHRGCLVSPKAQRTLCSPTIKNDPTQCHVINMFSFLSSQ